MAPTRVMKTFSPRSQKAQRPKHRKGRPSKRSVVVKEVVSEVAGLLPYEKRLLDMFGHGRRRRQAHVQVRQAGWARTSAPSPRKRSRRAREDEGARPGQLTWRDHLASRRVDGMDDVFRGPPPRRRRPSAGASPPPLSITGHDHEGNPFGLRASRPRCA